MNLTFTIAEFGSDLHQHSIVLRDHLLRKPLGLRFTDIELAQEIEEVHLVALIDEIVVGVGLLRILDEKTVKLRQFAVNDNLHGKGIGKKLVHFAEQVAKDMGKEMIELHARVSASRFYEKLGYKQEGDIFQEVGIDHYKMTKSV